MRWLLFLPVRIVGILTRYGVAGLLWLGLGLLLVYLFG